MGVDPFIQETGNSQSINPYAYIMNNPLFGTDPSGYCSASRINTAKGSVCGDSANHEKAGSFLVNQLKKAGAKLTQKATEKANGAGTDGKGKPSNPNPDKLGDIDKRTITSADGTYTIYRGALTAMLFDVETYGGAIQEVSEMIGDSELREFLGSNYDSFVSDLETDFETGWGKVKLANSVNPIKIAGFAGFAGLTSAVINTTTKSATQAAIRIRQPAVAKS